MQNGQRIGSGSSQYAPYKSALPQPVNALPYDAEDDEILHDSVQRVKAVAATQHTGVHHKKFDRTHRRGNGPDAQEISFAVMGVGKALHRAEQKQRCG